MWWAGLVRARTTSARRGDLHLFLIGPQGSDEHAVWRGLRSRIESDERFCRKFVWLPSLKPGPEEIGSFLDRTFLAEPWAGGSGSQVSLDPMERIVEEVGAGNSLTLDEARRWIARLDAGDTNGFQQMAEDLMAILESKR